MALILLFIYACLGMAVCSFIFNIAREKEMLKQHEPSVLAISGLIIVLVWPGILVWIFSATFVDVIKKLIKKDG